MEPSPVEVEKPQDVVVQAVAAPQDPELASLESQMLQLQAQGQAGANWFYWVAALSLVNSALAAVGSDRSFVIGLGFTAVTDAIAGAAAAENPNIATAVRAGAFVFALGVAAVVAGFGWLSNKRITPVFALGITLYFLDGVIYLIAGSWLSVGFHAFAIFNMWQGMMAYRRLSTILQSQPAIA